MYALLEKYLLKIDTQRIVTKYNLYPRCAIFTCDKE